uniref:Ycf34 n=1 Tax=Sonderella linearis TaxID=110477 RepID=A0A1Z1MM46_9FLOR|nr:hypothetical protein [Sonderella linearis]ARW67006.1 hypothetical protein [Sonderella linearis]
MCICINCRHIYNCKTYSLIAEQHYMRNESKKNYTFIPINTTIAININKKYQKIFLDWDLIECLSFTEKPGYWSLINN